MALALGGALATMSFRNDLSLFNRNASDQFYMLLNTWKVFRKQYSFDIVH